MVVDVVGRGGVVVGRWPRERAVVLDVPAREHPLRVATPPAEDSPRRARRRHRRALPRRHPRGRPRARRAVREPRRVPHALPGRQARRAHRRGLPPRRFRPRSTRGRPRGRPRPPRARDGRRPEPNPRFPAQIHHPHVVGVAAGGEPSRRPDRHIPGNPRARRRTRAHGASRGSRVARVGRERGRRVVHTTDARGRRRSRGVHLRVLLRSTRTERTLVAWAPGRYHTLLFVVRCVADRFVAEAFPRERRRVIRSPSVRIRIRVPERDGVRRGGHGRDGRSGVALRRRAPRRHASRPSQRHVPGRSKGKDTATRERRRASEGSPTTRTRASSTGTSREIFREIFRAGREASVRIFSTS